MFISSSFAGGFARYVRGRYVRAWMWYVGSLFLFFVCISKDLILQQLEQIISDALVIGNSRFVLLLVIELCIVVQFSSECFSCIHKQLLVVSF